MAINKNHLFEDLDGVKCAIVETTVSPERVEFLKPLLTYNNFKVIVVPSPPPKATPAPKPAEGETLPEIAVELPPETFTVGVTDSSFNSINAIFGRTLKTPDGHIVTLAYWQQKETVSNDEKPYFN